MSEGMEERMRHHEKDTLTTVFAGDVVEVLDARDAIIAAQADIVLTFAVHKANCDCLKRGKGGIPVGYKPCTCGLSAALLSLQEMRRKG